MDNAAKALVIAGGVLLAILIITVGMYAWQQNANFINQQEQEEEQERINAFNKQYEAYQRQALRGVDVITVINKVRDNNIRNKDVAELQIIWKIELGEKFANLKKGVHTEAKSGNIINQILNNKELIKEFKALHFKCTSLKYSNITGKVNEIVFKQYTSADGDFF